MAKADLLSTLNLFQTLTDEQRQAVFGLMKTRNIARGDLLVNQDEPSDALFIVLSGAFEVHRSGSTDPIAQIRAGEVIGEIGFFAGTPRTANVTAIRDATVLELDRSAYEQAAQEAPAVQGRMLAALARRLGDTSAQLSPEQAPLRTRTVAIMQGGQEPLPPGFFELLRISLTAAGAAVIDRSAVEQRFGRLDPGSDEVRHWLNALEWEGKLLVYLADPDLTAWSGKCLRQADMVVMAVRGQAPSGKLTPLEALACEVHPVKARRLVRVHDYRSSSVTGTSAWLQRIEVFLHHHLALEDDADLRSLARFLKGGAVGFAAGGGGGFGPAHVGIYKAFRERGILFDLFIGTSVGAAVSAGFALRLTPEEIDEGTHDIFVISRGFKRPTWPRYALLDHKAFDQALARNCGPALQIEDCWHPFFAVATDLSRQQLKLIRTGSLWKAVRASASIPGILPPVFTEEGTMLVDGGMMDNAPLAPLKKIKTGPNLVVHFGRREEQRFECRYEDIPGRWELIASILNPFRKRRLPRAPGAASVLMRSMMAHQSYDLPAGPEDLVLQPPPFPGSSFMSFDQHSRVFQASYRWALEKLDELEQAEHPALKAMKGQTDLRS